MRNYTCAVSIAVRAARVLSVTLLIGVFALPARADWIPTNTGVGADVEIRESAPVDNRGSSTEIASRVKNDFIAGNANDGGDRNSAIYTKFDLSEVVLTGPVQTSFEMTYRNNNLSEARI